MQELLQRVEELRMENDYQLRLKDMNYNDKIKELTEKFIQEMESLKTKNQVLKTDKDKEEAKHEEKTADLMEKQSNDVRELGRHFIGCSIDSVLKIVITGMTDLVGQVYIKYVREPILKCKRISKRV